MNPSIPSRPSEAPPAYDTPEAGRQAFVARQENYRQEFLDTLKDKVKPDAKPDAQSYRAAMEIANTAAEDCRKAGDARGHDIWSFHAADLSAQYRDVLYKDDKKAGETFGTLKGYESAPGSLFSWDSFKPREGESSEHAEDRRIDAHRQATATVYKDVAEGFGGLDSEKSGERVERRIEKTSTDSIAKQQLAAASMEAEAIRREEEAKQALSRAANKVAASQEGGSGADTGADEGGKPESGKQSSKQSSQDKPKGGSKGEA
jgi:hypothetical protein